MSRLLRKIVLRVAHFLWKRGYLIVRIRPYKDGYCTSARFIPVMGFGKTRLASLRDWAKDISTQDWYMFYLERQASDPL